MIAWGSSPSPPGCSGRYLPLRPSSEEGQSFSQDLDFFRPLRQLSFQSGYPLPIGLLGRHGFLTAFALLRPFSVLGLAHPLGDGRSRQAELLSDVGERSTVAPVQNDDLVAELLGIDPTHDDTFPRRSRRCERCPPNRGKPNVHHVLEWVLDDGPTNLENSALLCEAHHTKVHHGFTVERQPDGTWHTYRPDGTEILIGAPLRM